MAEVITNASGRPLKSATGTRLGVANLAPKSMYYRETDSVLTSGLPLPRPPAPFLSLPGMRLRPLWGSACRLWTRRAPCQPHRCFSYSSPPLEELFIRGGPLRTFLERQAESKAHLQVGGPELTAVAKLLIEKEQELQETEHLLHGKGQARGAES